MPRIYPDPYRRPTRQDKRAFRKALAELEIERKMGSEPYQQAVAELEGMAEEDRNRMSERAARRLGIRIISIYTALVFGAMFCIFPATLSAGIVLLCLAVSYSVYWGWRSKRHEQTH
jgi:CHASE3 domain sensor protein